MPITLTSKESKDTFILYDFIYKKMKLPELVPYSGILVGLPIAYGIYNTYVKQK